MSDFSEGAHKKLRDKVRDLAQSVSEVYKYELLTTNQYLKQMELVLEIFNEIYMMLPYSEDRID